MVFQQLFDPEACAFSYLIGADGEAALVDGVFEHAESYVRLAETLGVRIRYAIETHLHADHRTSAACISERTGARLCGSSRGAAGAHEQLADGRTLACGGLQIRVLETPGHTDDGICLLLGDAVLTGDTLLIGATGRCDLQGGDPGALYDSVTRKLFTLPDATRVYPGHDYFGRTESTIGDEKRTNPRLAGIGRAAFVAAERAMKRPMPRRLAEVLPLNRKWGG